MDRFREVMKEFAKILENIIEENPNIVDYELFLQVFRCVMSVVKVELDYDLPVQRSSNGSTAEQSLPNISSDSTAIEMVRSESIVSSTFIVGPPSNTTPIQPEEVENPENVKTVADSVPEKKRKRGRGQQKRHDSAKKPKIDLQEPSVNSSTASGDVNELTKSTKEKSKKNVQGHSLIIKTNYFADASTSESSTVSQKSAGNRKNQSTGPQYTCYGCQMTFSCQTKYGRHCNSAENQESLECELCDFKSHPKELEQHVNKEHPGPFKCSTCGEEKLELKEIVRHFKCDHDATKPDFIEMLVGS